jgi:hypothetical protein
MYNIRCLRTCEARLRGNQQRSGVWGWARFLTNGEGSTLKDSSPYADVPMAYWPQVQAANKTALLYVYIAMTYLYI